MPLSRLLCLGLILAVAPAFPTPARADDDAIAAKDHYNKGLRLYDLLRYRDAAREFEQAYEAKPDPAFLYNMAQALRLAGDKERAIGTYRSFLRRMPSAKNRAEVEQQIAALQKVVDDERAAQQADPSGTLKPGSVKPEPAEEPRPTAVASSTGTNPASAKPSEARPASGSEAHPIEATKPAPAGPSGETSARPGFALKIAGAAALAVGVAAAATGVVFGVQAQAAGDSITNATPGTPFDPAAEDRFKLDRTLSIAMIAGGGAVAVTGAVLMVLGLRAGRPAAVTVLPVIGAGQAGAAARIEF